MQAPFKDAALHEKLHIRLPHAKYINCVRFLGGKNLKKDEYFRGIDAEGEDANPYAVAIKTHAEHRSKYEQMSQLSPLEEIPEQRLDDSGSIHFAMELQGHSVVYLRLQ